MSFHKSIRYIVRHPLNRGRVVGALARYAYFHCYCRFVGHGFTGRFGERSNLYYDLGLAGAVGNYYNGLDDYEEMSFLLHYLREDDLFVDVGGNIGSYTVLASGEVGCRSIVYEPVPETVTYLKMNISSNHIAQRVTVREKCVGDTAGVSYVTTQRGAMNRIAMQPGNETARVETVVLDHELSAATPSVIKLDVEGFEMQVLQGARQVLLQPFLGALIVELNGSGGRYGYTDGDIDRFLQEYGFKPYAYQPAQRIICALQHYRSDLFNTIYLRNEAEAQRRISTARQYAINGRLI